MVADNQFSTLGIVLMAALGRLARATGANRRPETREKPTNKKPSVVSPLEDRGEVISRGDGDSLPGSGQGHTGQKPSKKKLKTLEDKANVSRTKKTSKRKKNAIDDLFSGLL